MYFEIVHVIDLNYPAPCYMYYVHLIVIIKLLKPTYMYIISILKKNATYQKGHLLKDMQFDLTL